MVAAIISPAQLGALLVGVGSLLTGIANYRASRKEGGPSTMTVHRVMLAVAIVLFVLAGLNVHFGSLQELDLIAFGAAFFAVAHL